MEARYTEIIDKYLNGELEGKELLEFREKLKTNKQLQQELKLEEELNMAISEDDVIDFRKEIIEVRQSMQKEDSGEGGVNKNSGITPIFRKKKQWYLIAAAVIILIGFSFYFIFMIDRSYTNEQLYARYYMPYPSDVSIRSDDISTDNPINLGFFEYEKSNFREAADYFNSVLSKDSTNIPVRFYFGVSCMETGSLSEAESSFKIVIENKFNLFTEQAKWYLVLNYLKMDEREYNVQVQKLLDEIIADKGDRAEDASSLLKKLSH
ncbi:MAG: hypothetical protein K8R68_06370 [Bacteroidales bacterium]|nr:hypothetical protein [Bacteroidales bacterium]